MIFDLLNLFSDKQAAVTGASENVIELKETGTVPYGNKLNFDLGKGNKIPLLVQVVGDPTGITKLEVAVETSDAENFATKDVLVTSSFVPKKAGDKLPLSVLPYGLAKRYLRLNYTVTGSSSTCKITAGITAGNEELA